MNIDGSAPLQQKFLCFNFHDGDDTAIHGIIGIGCIFRLIGQL